MLKYIVLFVLQVFKLANGEEDELKLQYIADVVTQSQKAAYTYELPNNAYEYIPTNTTLTSYGTFDYIIVGAGSAGGVLATRLSENRNLRILLLEAGGEDNTFVNIPGMYLYQQGTKYNWNFLTTPQKTFCLGMINRQCKFTTGKGLGGSSLINGGLYVRASKYDHDSWAENGNIGWSFNDVLPYYKKSENSQILGEDEYQGKGGLLNVEYPKPFPPSHFALIDANLELGLKFLDNSGKEQIGVGRFPYNNLHGVRDHIGRAFLRRAESRANLTISPHSYVTRIVLDRNKNAQGVLFTHKGQSFYANATKEVILSAGTYNSAQLLMLSGIGPAKHLKSLNISVVSDLPVGENYQNHAAFWSLYFTTNDTTPADTIYELSRQYLKSYGRFTTSTGQGFAFLRTPSATTPRNIPNIEMFMIIQYRNDFERVANNYDNNTFYTYWNYNASKVIKVTVNLLKPKSIGSVTLNTTNPFDYPLINANFLSDPKGLDIQALYEAINAALEMSKTKPFRELDARLHYSILPECESYEKQSKEQWYCLLRHLTTHMAHPVGTCKMAPRNRNGVVDHNLKVYGVNKLRVVDASIIPEAVNGHTHAPTVMIAEKIADLLKKQ